jgi:hypothetical protein
MLFIVTAGIALFAYPVLATDVGGQILTDTTWNLAGSPYNLTSTVQIEEGVTLTIDPGVIVNGQGYEIQVGGVLNSIGTKELIVKFSEVNIIPDINANSMIELHFCEIKSGGIFNLGGNIGRGALVLKNSVVQNTGDGEPIWIWSPTSDCYIEKNIFGRILILNILQKIWI